MAALTKSRNTRVRTGARFSDPLAAAAVVFAGGMVMLDAAGNAVPGKTAVGLIARGVAQYSVDNSAGAAGDLTVESEPGVYQFDNSAAADLITRAEIGDIAYVVDDQTVAKTNGGATRSAAGTIEDVDADGVWVRIG